MDRPNFNTNVDGFVELKPFRFWCQKVLPLVYDDSLSYYELLCKVVDYLNKTMTDVDLLSKDYIKLKEWINNYFENLDVQTEINNKLDVFASDGTLSNLIKPFITANANPVFVNSVSEMKDTLKTYILKSTLHIYTYNGTAFVDTSSVYNFNDNNYLLCSADYTINNDFFVNNPDTTIFTLPVNGFYRCVSLSDENISKLGVPKISATFALYITKPYSKSNDLIGFRLFEITALSRANTVRYYAFSYNDDTLETLVWHKVVNEEDIDNALLNTINTDFGTNINDSYMTSNPDTSILTLDYNVIYRVSKLSTENNKTFGFTPDMNKAGNLYILRPWKRGGDIRNFTHLIFVCGTYNKLDMYSTLLGGSEKSVSDVSWICLTNRHTYSEKYLVENANTIYLIGDSIVEGYGGSNYNGGSNKTGHSDEEIPNNVKTWYRNTDGTCWSNMLKNYVESNYPNTKVINNGIGGLTVPQLYANFDTLVGDDATAVIIGIGINNRNTKDKKVNITDALVNCVWKAFRRGLKCIVLTPTLIKTGNVVDKNNDCTVNAYVLNAINQGNAQSINVHSELKSYLNDNNISLNSIMNDDLHPNDKGYEIIYNIILKNLGL